MKARPRNDGKTGTQRTKLLPDGAGIAVRRFPLHLFDANGDAPHDLGPVFTPEQMDAKVPPGATPEDIDRAARQALDALIGCGPRHALIGCDPRKRAPHLYTALALAHGLARLRDYALAGDRAAMGWLGYVLSQAVADLGELLRRNPETVREWSRKQNVVPVLHGKNLGHRKQLAANLDAFGVGEASPCRINQPKGKKAPDISTPANAFAGHLCQHLDAYRAIFAILQKPVPPWVRMASKLPPLSKAVWERWADAAWACLLDATAGHPEESPVLRPLGNKARYKHDRIRRTADETERLLERAGYQRAQQRSDGKGTLDANTRAAIRERLNTAIRDLASQVPLG